jgi:drug/metabolite transporter (DMT)-like permease
VADLSLLLLTLLWGTTFTLVKGALEIGSTGLFLVCRFGVACLVLGAVALARRDRPGPGAWRHGLWLGLFMLGGFVFQTLGLRLTTPARSGFITGLAVLVVPFVARFTLGRQVRLSAWAGVGLAVFGLGLLTYPSSEVVVTPEMRLGDLLTAVGALAYAAQIIFMSEWSARHPLVPFTLIQVAVVLAGSLAMLPFDGLRLEAARWPQFAGVVLFTGVLMTAGAFFVMNWAQRHTSAVRAALIYALEPVAAAAFSMVVIDEKLGVAGWIGGALIVLGVVAGELGGIAEARGEARQAARAAAGQTAAPGPTAT